MSEFKRNKATIAASGLDPDFKWLNRAHAIRSSRKKRLEKAIADYTESLEHVERYWEAVFRAVEERREGAA